MVKFKNKKTNEIVEEYLNFYIEKMRSNPNYEEVKETKNKKCSKVEKIEEDKEESQN